MSYTRRSQANSVESDQKEEWDKDVTVRKLGSTTVGSKSEVAASPLVGPERKKSVAIPSVSARSGRCGSRCFSVVRISCPEVFFFSVAKSYSESCISRTCKRD